MSREKSSSSSVEQLSSSSRPSQVHGSDMSSPPMSMETISIQPHHAVFAGLGVIAAGATVTGALTYWRGAKSLREDGINPATRVRIIPLATSILVLSTVLTGTIGLAGFLIMKEMGLFKSDRAEIPSAKEAAKLIRDPKGYIRDLIKREAKESPKSS